MAKVPIVGDDAMMRQLLLTMAQRMGHDCLYALNCGEGLARALSTPFDVVFLDVRLPDGNGKPSKMEGFERNENNSRREKGSSWFHCKRYGRRHGSSRAK